MDNGKEILIEQVFSEALPIYVELRCPACKLGLINSVGPVSQTEQGVMIIMHKCSNCDNEELIPGQSFPQVIHQKGKKIGGKTDLEKHLGIETKSQLIS